MSDTKKFFLGFVVGVLLSILAVAGVVYFLADSPEKTARTHPDALTHLAQVEFGDLKAHELSEAQLHQFFAAYNDVYFDGKLNPDTQINYFTPQPGDSGYDALAETSYYADPALPSHMRFNTKIKGLPVVVLYTMFHEDCHIALKDDKAAQSESEHGPKFQSCMRRLANEGAFDPLW